MAKKRVTYVPPPKPSTPAGVWFVVALVVLGGLLSLSTGLSTIVLGLSEAEASAGAPSGGVLVIAGFLEIVLAIIAFSLAWGLVRGSNRARWAVIILGLVVAGAQLMTLILLPDFRIVAFIRLVVELAAVGLLLSPRSAQHFTGGRPTE